MDEQSSILLTAVADTAIAAFCIWLTVRIINRREAWAKRTAAVATVVLVGYPLSIGPVFFACHRAEAPEWLWNVVHIFYEPLWNNLFFGPEWLFQLFISYSLLGSPPIEL